MKNLIIIIALCLLVFGCNESDMTQGAEVQDSFYSENCEDAYALANMGSEALNGKPTIYIVGDSISLGYTNRITSNFPEFQTIHTPDNARSSLFGACLVKKWMTGKVFDLCTVNHGLHDLVTESKWASSVEVYKSNLEKELEVLKVSCKKIVAATTTRIPDNSFEMSTHLLPDYNNALTDVMLAHDIPVCDLNAASEEIPHLYLALDTKDNMHLTAAGYSYLGDELSECINNELDNSYF